jgi:hypothetical protein
MNIMLPFSGSKSKPNNQQSYVLASCLICLLFDTEDGGSTFLQNTGRFLPGYNVAHVVTAAKASTK